MSRAKTFLLMLAVLGLCGGAALAQPATTDVPFDFIVDRDNCNSSALDNYPGEWHGQFGGWNLVRIKASDHQWYGDWQTGPIGDVYSDVTIPYTKTASLCICPNSSWPVDPVPINIAAVWSENDWVEGTGGGYSNFNWSDPSVNFAATYMYAQDVMDPSTSTDPQDPNYPPMPDLGRVVSWVSPTLGQCTFLGTFLDQGDKGDLYGHGWAPWPNQFNSIANSQAYSISSADEWNYVCADLDDALVQDLLTNVNNRGLVVYDLPPEPTWANKIVRTREHATNPPKIVVTVNDVYVGDATLDGCVDGLDYVSWSNNYRTGTTWIQGDFIDDDYVDGLDYVAWSNNYDAGVCPTPPGAVPEPATMALLAIGGLALLKRRRRS